MVLTGEEFYKQFFGYFQIYVEENQKEYNNISKISEWTQFVKDSFLGELAKKLGFDKTNREGIYGIDLTWERTSDNMSVAIEHENDVKTIWESEVPDLLKAAAPLKVLITYVKDKDFPGAKIASRLYQMLKEKPFDKEFLLILGTETLARTTDWIGYLYRGELVIKTLVHCSNVSKARMSPGKKAWETRKAKRRTRKEK